MAKKISKYSKRRIAVLGVASICIIGYFCFTLIGYIYNYISLTKEKETLNAELLALEKEKNEIKSEIVKLNDPEYVARYAKEKFLYSSDGEYVIKLDDTNERKTEIAKESNNTLIIVITSGILVLAVVLLNNKKIVKKNIVSA